jgi:acyl-coenzyme A synthetase/AMP-(fatty) acid ligase
MRYSRRRRALVDHPDVAEAAVVGRADEQTGANVIFTPELPKTRSGKIMRRLLRDVANNRVLGDTTTLADPTVVEEIRTRATAEAATED